MQHVNIAGWSPRKGSDQACRAQLFMNNDQQLKPCPWCGGKATLKVDRALLLIPEHHFVSCDKCAVYGPLENRQHTPTVEAAIKAWNTRPATINKAQLLEWLHLKLTGPELVFNEVGSTIAKREIELLKEVIEYVQTQQEN